MNLVNPVMELDFVWYAHMHESVGKRRVLKSWWSDRDKTTQQLVDQKMLSRNPFHPTVYAVHRYDDLS